MINSEPATADTQAAHEAAVHRIVGSGARGGLVLAGIATAIVIGLWLAFYLLVFLPRSPAP